MVDLTKFSTEGFEDEVDSVGSGYVVHPSGLYPAKIENAYFSTSQGGATAVNIVAALEDGSKIKEAIYITNKKGEPFYKDKNTGAKKLLPGMHLINSLCTLTVDKELSAMDKEDKLVEIRNYDLNKDIPTKVEVLVELLGTSINIGLLELHENKSKKVGKAYVPTNEKREKNTIDKFFRDGDNLTTTEIKAGSTEAEFVNKWTDKNSGVVRDKFKEVAAAPGVVSGAVPGVVAVDTATADDMFKDE